jgi:alpha-L-rhamnosidase
MVGWVRMKVRAPEGTDIRIRHAEVRNPDGTIYRDNLRLDPSQPLLGAHQEDHYICRGGKDEVFEPCFTYHGFRYVEVTGLVSPPRPGDLVGRVLQSSSAEAGSFECSSPELNRVMAAIQWTQRGNMHSVPTDCPQRDERLGWSGDAQVFSQTAMYNRDMAAFLTKWLRDVREAQTLDGRFPDFAPHPFDPSMRASGNPGWADVGVILPWRAYVEYGDPRFIRDAFDSARRWVDHTERTFPDLVWKEDGLIAAPPYGDWLNADTFVSIPGIAKTGGKVPNGIYGTAFFANSARLVGCMAERLGMTEEAHRYLSLARRIRDAFVKAFVTGDGVIRGRTQAGYALALSFDLLPAKLRAPAARNMVAALRPYHGAPSTGIQSTLRMMTELVRAGQAETAYGLLNRREMPSWIYMVEHGGTTIWERWDGWVEGRGFQDPGMNSFNHVAIGSVGEWMWRFIGGICPDEDAPGYENVIIAPVPGGGLTSAKAVHHTIRGPVSVSWHLHAGELTLEAAVPPNMTATVIIPDASPGAVTESGRPVAASPGVRSLGRKAGGLWLQVQSGRYTFVRRAGSPGNRRAVPVAKRPRVAHPQ